MPGRGADTIFRYSINAYSIILYPYISVNPKAGIFSYYGYI